MIDSSTKWSGNVYLKRRTSMLHFLKEATKICSGKYLLYLLSARLKNNCSCFVKFAGSSFAAVLKWTPSLLFLKVSIFKSVEQLHLRTGFCRTPVLENSWWLLSSIKTFFYNNNLNRKKKIFPCSEKPNPRLSCNFFSKSGVPFTSHKSPQSPSESKIISSIYLSKACLRNAASIFCIFVLTHFQQMFHLCGNQVVGFY